jgi:hypothetical protein
MNLNRSNEHPSDGYQPGVEPLHHTLAVIEHTTRTGGTNVCNLLYSKDFYASSDFGQIFVAGPRRPIGRLTGLLYRGIMPVRMDRRQPTGKGR